MVLRIVRDSGAVGGTGQTIAQSLYTKKILLITSLIATVGLVGFFLKHRLLCHDMGK